MNRFLMFAIFFAALLGAPAETRAQTQPSWVTNLSLWRWWEIPNTALSSVQPSPVPWGGTGPRSKIDAWCGAALQWKNSIYMLGAAGGHGDYAGNEVDAIELNVETPRWVERSKPTPDPLCYNQTEVYGDLSRAATHTYNSTHFINARNRMMLFPIPGMYATGLPDAPAGFGYANGTNVLMGFNMATNTWDHPNTYSKWPGTTGDMISSLCVKHPVTEDVYYSRNYGGGWWRWTQATDTWTQLSNVSRAPWYVGAAIDPGRDRILVVGGYSPSAPLVLDFYGTSIAATFSGLPLDVTGYPGVIYDQANDRFLVVFNSGSTIKVYRVHPETWVVDEPAMSGTLPAARPNGIHNSVQYAPELGGFVIANSYTGNVQFVRTSVGTVAEKVSVRREKPLLISPNPFRYSTGISFPAGLAGKNSVQILDSRGRVVRALGKTYGEAGGRLTVAWDGRDGQEKRLAKGVFAVSVRAGQSVFSGAVFLDR